MIRPIVKSFFDPTTFTVTYVVREPEGPHCAIVDSVLDYQPNSGRTSTKSADKVVEYIESNGLTVDWLLETHAHADHLSAAPYLKDRVGGATGIGERIADVQAIFKDVFNAGADFATDGSQFDRLFVDGDTFGIGELSVRVMHTPGHTPACLTYVMGDAAFIGDTLFMPDYGTARADFPGGDAATLYRSIQKIFSLPDSTRVFLCHDYLASGREEHVWETTVADQKSHNVHIGGGVTETEFVAMRTKRDKTLSMPVLILPSVQVNMRAGHLPPPEDNGVAYLKIPVNLL
jgi:glyoxylase-like metal-dependent hydrolase (beta-lactamase superfamily II)